MARFLHERAIDIVVGLGWAVVATLVGGRVYYGDESFMPPFLTMIPLLLMFAFMWYGPPDQANLHCLRRRAKPSGRSKKTDSQRNRVEDGSPHFKAACSS